MSSKAEQARKLAHMAVIPLVVSVIISVYLAIKMSIDNGASWIFSDIVESIDFKLGASLGALSLAVTAPISLKLANKSLKLSPNNFAGRMRTLSIVGIVLVAIAIIMLLLIAAAFRGLQDSDALPF